MTRSLAVLCVSGSMRDGAAGKLASCVCVHVYCSETRRAISAEHILGDYSRLAAHELQSRC